MCGRFRLSNAVIFFRGTFGHSDRESASTIGLGAFYVREFPFWLSIKISQISTGKVDIFFGPEADVIANSMTMTFPNRNVQLSGSGDSTVNFCLQSSAFCDAPVKDGGWLSIPNIMHHSSFIFASYRRPSEL